MKESVKIGIIICDRYRTCAGGKCLRALKKREGAFSIYQGKEVELVGYTTCDGCPGGNVEYAPAEMKKMVPRLSILPPVCWWDILPAHIYFIFVILSNTNMD